MNVHVNPGEAPKGRKPRTTASRAAQPMDRVRLALKSANDDKERAIAALITAAATSATLSKFFIEKGARAAVGESIRTDNARIFNDDQAADVTRSFTSTGYAVGRGNRVNMPEPPILSTAHKARQKATAKVLELLSIRLPNGVLLANARRSDLQIAANHYEKQGKDMLHKATFYARVERGLTDGRKVSEAFDNTTLTVIYEQTRLATGAEPDTA